MTAPHHQAIARPDNGYVVQAPRSTDAIGRALRGSFGIASLPDDMRAALRKLDNTRGV